MDILKRGASLLLALVLCLSLLPAGVLASEEPETAEAVPLEDAAPQDAAGEGEGPEGPAASDEPEALTPAPEPQPQPQPTPTADTAQTPSDESAQDADAPAPDTEYFPAADGVSLPDSLYLVQQQGGWCTLCSATMMIRARMYLSGNDSWSSVTQSGVYSSAWLPGAGLYFNWTYRFNGNSITVSHATVNGISSSTLKSLLDKHPEGIVLYVYSVPHAILVTDYVGDTFYGSDPANSSVRGRRPIANTWLASQLGGTQSSVLNAANAYWYISSYSIKSTAWYTVTLDANGGSCGETSRSVKGGSTLGSLPTPTRSGYYFDGWYTDPYVGTHVNENTSVMENTTLYAHWYAVSGSIAFSQSPATINFSKGTNEVSVEVTGSGYINGVTLDFALEDAAADKLWAEWGGDGGGQTRTVTFHADPSSSGTYHATFYMYDADTGQSLNQRSLTINVINEEPYLDNISQTDLFFRADSLAVERVYIAYGGTNGDLPEGYVVECLNNHPEAISAELGAFDGGGRPLIVRAIPSFSLPMGMNSLMAAITVRLLDPAGGVCSEMTVNAAILATSGICGGDYEGNVRWELDGGTLRISVIDPASDEGGNMWNYETVYGRAPWYLWAGSIRRAEIDPGVTRIGSCAFYQCTALESVSIPETVTEIGEKAFSGCSSLYSVEVPGSVGLVAEDVFFGCSALEELRFNEGTTLLYAGALDGCSALRTMYIPLSMAELQIPAVTLMKDIYYNGTKAQWAQLDAACSLTDKLPQDTAIHTMTVFTGSDVTAILSTASVDSLDGESKFFDAAYILQQLVGLD